MPRRRRFLRNAAVGGLGALATAAVAGGISGCGDRGTPATARPGTTVTTVRYGSDPSQFGELSLPPSPRDGLPVAMIIHGGFWRTSYGLELGRPLAADLLSAGVATWNIEYRRVGGGLGSGRGAGGWPATALDVAAAADALAGAAQHASGDRLDLERVVAIGHSAGGQLAGWLAARTGFRAGTPGAGPAVRVRGAISQAGVLDLIDAARTSVGGDAVPALLGGDPDERPEVYHQASPAEQVPIGVPVVCVHGREDTVVPPRQSERFVAADARASRAGAGRARLLMVDGDHFDQIEVASSAWRTARTEALRLLR